MKNFRQSKMFTVDLINCHRDLSLSKKFLADIKYILKKNNIKVLKTITKKFLPTNGATVLMILAESHLAIHTWPEKDLVNLDIFLCNFRKNNFKKVKNALKDLLFYFQATKQNINEIKRLT